MRVDEEIVIIYKSFLSDYYSDMIGVVIEKEQA
jgi:hypothetical protein